MSIAVLDSVEDLTVWSDLLRQLPTECQDVYFTPEYHNLHVANGDGKGTCFHVTDGQHSLMVMGIMIGIRDGLYDLQTCNGYGGPIATRNAPSSFLDAAWQICRQKCRSMGIVAIFFRLHPLVRTVNLLPSDAVTKHDRKTVLVDLSEGIQEAWSKADSRFRNRVSKARKQGVTIEWNTESSWQQFETLYAEAMERLAAVDSLKFNDAYFLQLRNWPAASIAGVFESGELLAGAVFLEGSLFSHYHLGARKEGSDNFLMNALFQSGLEVAAEGRKTAVHFGGGRTSAQDDSLLRFKKRLGGDLMDFSIALVVCCPKNFSMLCGEKRPGKFQSSGWLLSYRQPVQVNG